MTNSEKIVARFEKQAMATIFRHLTGTIDWGFFTDEHERMHLQTVDKEHKTKDKKIRVHLERLGKRIFEVERRPDDPKLRKAVQDLQEKLLTERDVVENKWTNLMVAKKWIKTDLSGENIIVTAYPNHEWRFTRTINLRKAAPGKIDRLAPLLQSKDVKIKDDSGSLSVSVSGEELIDIPLERILWQD